MKLSWFASIEEYTNGALTNSASGGSDLIQIGDKLVPVPTLALAVTLSIVALAALIGIAALLYKHHNDKKQNAVLEKEIVKAKEQITGKTLTQDSNIINSKMNLVNLNDKYTPSFTKTQNQTQYKTYAQTNGKDLSNCR